MTGTREALRPLVAAAGLGIVALTIVLLASGRQLLVPLAVSLFVWHLINALANAYGRIDRRLPVWLCRLAAILTIFALLLVVLEVVRDNVAQVSAAAPTYQANLERLLASTYPLLGLDEPPSVADVVQKINVAAVVRELATALGGIAGSVGIVVIYVLFLLLEQNSFDAKLNALFPDPRRAARVRATLGQITAQIQSYIWIKTLMSLLTGGVSYVILALVGVDFAGFWALVIFLLNYIPTIGSLLGVIFPAVLALVQFGSLVPSLFVALTLGAAQFMIGNVLEPRITGRTLNLSPLVIILALMLWGSLWGVVGMILSVPIMVIVMIVCSQFPATRPVAIALSQDGDLGPLAEPDPMPAPEAR